MVILHDAIKTIQNGVFAFFLKKEQKPVSFQKQLKTFFSQPWLVLHHFGRVKSTDCTTTVKLKKKQQNK